MNISLKDIHIEFEQKIIITDCDLTLCDNRKYGLVGINGSGKTTLLNYIYDNFNNQYHISLLEQELNINLDKTPYTILLESNKTMYNVLKKYNYLETKDKLSDNELDEFNILSQKLVDLEYDKSLSLITKILNGLGFDEQKQKSSYSTFSGGWRMRISLARMLYNVPDILLLDEPTNHLDLDTSIWLSNYLHNMKTYNKIIMIVSHDRTFLNNTCTHIIHLYNKRLNYYEGNYDKYLHQRKVRDKENRNKWIKIQKQEKLMKKKSLPKEQVKEFIKKHEHLRPVKNQYIRLYLNDPKQDQELLESVISIKTLTFGYDEELLFDSLSLDINIDEHIILVGKNGVGKSTLLKLLCQQLSPTLGSISYPWSVHLRKDNNIDFGYYQQDGTNNISNHETPITYIKSMTNLNKEKIHQYLGCFALPTVLHTSPFSQLSGGQKSRVYLLSILLQSPLVLLLDEPTNHLDMDTIQVLTSALNDYKGIVIIITHNLYLLENFNGVMLEIDDKTIYETTHEEYCENIVSVLNSS